MYEMKFKKVEKEVKDLLNRLFIYEFNRLCMYLKNI